ncbi:MAG: hypothetical protein QG553_554 [Patescibacteria group bacterium]|nr:hypothetical protein [Patescibacteria group bacterium]
MVFMNPSLVRAERDLVDQLSLPDNANKKRWAGIVCLAASGLITVGAIAANVLPDYAEQLDQRDLPPTHEEYCEENRDSYMSSCAQYGPAEPTTLDPYLPTPQS